MKHQIPLGDKQLIESMVHSKDKAALTFVCNMYMFLTQRQVPDMESLRITGDADLDGDRPSTKGRERSRRLLKRQGCFEAERLRG